MEYKDVPGQVDGQEKSRREVPPGFYHPVYRGEKSTFDLPNPIVKPGDTSVEIELMGRKKSMDEGGGERSAEHIREKLIENVKKLLELWTAFERKASKLETLGVTGFHARERLGDIGKYGRRGGAVGEYMKDLDSWRTRSGWHRGCQGSYRCETISRGRRALGGSVGGL